MRPIRSLVTLLWLATPALAASPEECRIVASLSRLHAAQAAVLASGGTDLGAVRRMREELASSRFAGLTTGARTFAIFAERETRAGLDGLTHDISRAASRQDAAALRDLGEDPGVREMLAAARRALARYDCDGAAGALVGADATPLAGARAGGATWVPDGLVTRLSLPAILVSIWFYLIGGAVLALGGATFVLVSRHLRRSRRRRHRFPVNLDVRFTVPGGTRDGAILDISCFGAKLRHSGLIEPGQKEIAVALLGTMRAGRIAWLNRHYAGLVLEERLATSEVLRVVAGGLASEAPPGAASPEPGVARRWVAPDAAGS